MKSVKSEDELRKEFANQVKENISNFRVKLIVDLAWLEFEKLSDNDLVNLLEGANKP